MTCELLYIGITCDQAPLAVRELLHPYSAGLESFLAQIGPLAPERLLLATCERFELYAYTDQRQPDRWMDRLASWFSISRNVLDRYVLRLHGEAVAAHLFRVAAGLESRIIGEGQILAQVRAAYVQAMDASALGPALSACGRTAIHTGRRVRNETSISAGVRSLSSITVQHLAQHLPALPTARVLVVGTGRLAGDVAASLAARGVDELVVCGRHAERASSIAQRFGGRSVAWSRLTDELAEADAAIICTSAPAYVVDTSALPAKRVRPIQIVDLSVPRNVDPGVGCLPLVTLRHLDELLAGRSTHSHDLAEAERIVADETARFSQWLRERRVAPQIAALIRQERSTATTSPREQSRRLHQIITRLKAGVAA